MSVSASDVKKLRDMTGVGMMDCKKALIETRGDVEKAVEFLRKKGMASAQKREGRETKEGTITAYIHPGSRLGVLLELNCETDFVAKTEDFQNLARDIAMQIAAANPLAVNRDDITAKTIEKEKEIYREQMKDQNKPEQVVEKIIQGKIEKYFQEVVLMEQAFVKDTNKTMKEYLLEMSGKLGEAMTVSRFVRFQLGEQ
ncbi:MAG TPA: translation elongation factor Ts [bacterium]|nr:translation elongation factor Ts [bacterium]